MQTFRIAKLAWSGIITAALVASVTTGLTGVSGPLRAVELETSQTRFDIAPRLEAFTALRRDTNDRRAIYYVTVDLPATAGEALKTLKFTLVRGRFFPRLRYRLDELEVFQGDRRNRGALLPIEATDYDGESETLTIHLADAVEPGQRITFAIKPVRNPSRQGVYLFEIGAVPAGEQPVTQWVGIGRLSIFGDSDPD